jgi:diacylglycerol kinase family enzyme
MGDGALDLFVARALNLKTISSVAASIANLQFDEEQLGHWRGREFHVETDPLQPVTVDGEPAGETPITVRVWPEAIQVVVPPTPQPLPQP